MSGPLPVLPVPYGTCGEDGLDMTHGWVVEFNKTLV
jgi:hypothetical protein